MYIKRFIGEFLKTFSYMIAFGSSVAQGKMTQFNDTLIFILVRHDHLDSATFQSVYSGICEAQT